MPAWWRRKPRVPELPEAPAFVQAYLDLWRGGWPEPAGFTVLDLETSGLVREGARILSFALLRIEDGVLRFGDLFEGTLRDPGGEDLTAVEIHQVVRSEVAAGVEPGEFARRSLALLGTDRIVGHHISFDKACLDRFFAARYGFTLLNEVVDTGQLAARLRDPVLGGFQGRERPLQSLDVLARAYGITPEARHSASGDVLTTALLFLKLHKAAQRRGIRRL